MAVCIYDIDWISISVIIYMLAGAYMACTTDFAELGLRIRGKKRGRGGVSREGEGCNVRPVVWKYF